MGLARLGVPLVLQEGVERRRGSCASCALLRYATQQERERRERRDRERERAREKEREREKKEKRKRERERARARERERARERASWFCGRRWSGDGVRVPRLQS